MACHLLAIEEPPIHKKEQESCHIFCHETITFCLVCKEDITEDYIFNKQLYISNHLQSIKHGESITSLFKICVPDPICNSLDTKYLDIVHNCVFDISMLLHQEPCYMCKQEGQLFCLICEDNISHSTDIVQTIQYNLVNHLQSEDHLQHLKDKVSWIYYMNEPTDFIQFHKSLLYCSVCKKTLDSSENTLLQTAVHHLEIEKHIPGHSVVNLRQKPQSNNCKNYNPLNHSNMPCTLKKKKKDKETSKIAVEFNLKKCINKTAVFRLNHKYLKEKQNNFYCEICQTVIEFNVNGSHLKKHCYSLEHNQILIDNAARYILTLQQKDDTIDFSNDNMKFQSVLNLFTRDSTLMSHLIYIRYDNDKFMCLLCDEPVRFTLCGKYIKSHFFRVCHQKNAYIINHSISINNSLNHNQLDFKSSQNASNINLECFNMSGNSNASVVYSKNTDLFNQPEMNEIFEALLEAQPLIKKNRQFILRNNQNYSCTICRTTILFSKWLHITMVYFNAHFGSKYHKSQLKIINASNNLNKVILMGDLSTLVEGNSKYLSTSTHINNSTSGEQNISSKVDDTASAADVTGEENLPTISNGIKCIADIKVKGLLKQTPTSLHVVHNKTIDVSAKGSSQNIQPNKTFSMCKASNYIECSERNLNKMLSQLHDKFKAHDQFIVMEENNICCKLCKCSLLLSNVETMAKDIQNHLSGHYHQDQYQHFCQGLAGIITTTVDNNQQDIDPCDKIWGNEAFETLLETQHVIKKNRQFIEKEDSYYICTACKKNISNSKRLHVLIINFNMHFKSKLHKSQVKFIKVVNPKNKIILIQAEERGEEKSNPLSISKRKSVFYNKEDHNIMFKHVVGVKTETILEENLRKHSSQTLVGKSSVDVEALLDEKNMKVEITLSKLVKKHGVLVLNKSYLGVKNYEFYCHVCQISIQFTVNGSHLKKHCNKLGHNQKLTENAIKFTLALQRDTLNPGDNYMQFELTLSQFTEDTSLMPHLVYISYDSEQFFCLLCDSPICFTPCGQYIKHHIFHRIHRQKAFRTNLNSNAINVFHQSDLNFLDATKGPKNMFNDNSQKLDVILNLNVNEENKQVENNIFVKEKECTKKVDLENTLKFQEKCGNREEDKVKCPDCKKDVDIYNEDVEFSLQLHMQEHKKLSEINVTSDIIHPYDMDYICPICQEIIPIFNNNLDLSVNLHFSDIHYDEVDYRDSLTTN